MIWKKPKGCHLNWKEFKKVVLTTNLMENDTDYLMQESLEDSVPDAETCGIFAVWAALHAVENDLSLPRYERNKSLKKSLGHFFRLGPRFLGEQGVFFSFLGMGKASTKFRCLLHLKSKKKPSSGKKRPSGTGFFCLSAVAGLLFGAKS